MTTYTPNEQKEIATTILNQMGGARILQCYFGASNFMFGEMKYNGHDCVYIAFNFKMNRIYKVCQIILQANDTYVMRFLNNKMEVKKEFDMVYCNTLKSIFSSTTGLNYLF